MMSSKKTYKYVRHKYYINAISYRSVYSFTRRKNTLATKFGGKYSHKRNV